MTTHPSSSSFFNNDLILEDRSITVIFSKDLKPGVLGKLFSRGLKAIILKDPRISKIWEGFLGLQNSSSEDSHDYRMPWQENLFTIALNHVPQNDDLGDMFRFTPGSIGHVARKMKIFPASGQDLMQAIPNYFLQNGKRVCYPDHLLRIAWELMSEVFRSTLPINNSQHPYTVKVEILKYPRPNELELIFPLLSDSSGKWTRIGQKIDAYKGLANGALNKKILRDVFAFSLLIPRMNSLFCGLNTLLSKGHKEPSEEGRITIGGEHVDGSKFLTGLASERDILITQIHNGECWVDLPLTSDSLAIFPSQKITKEFGFAPTVHRILMEKVTPNGGGTKRNITLSLSIVD